MSDKSNMFWSVYKKLESDVVDLSYYIHFSDETSENGHNQIWTFSNKIADLLIAISIQIESLFLELYKIEFKCSSDSIGAAIKQIDKKWNLSDKQVKIISPNMYFTDTHGLGNEFAPMGYIPSDENDYYVAYCSVKHNRINELHKANINSLIRAFVEEDADYLKKVSEFSKGIPDFESEEFLRYQDETPEPKRYTIKINKQ